MTNVMPNTMSNAVYIGIDLSGPSNTKDTALCCFESCFDGNQIILKSDLSDAQIYEFLQQFDSSCGVFVAIDAPLTYNEGGGYRDVDRALRKALNDKGFNKLGVMAPTMTKMVYLTLRGMRLREYCSQLLNVEIFETHPGGALVLDQVDYQDVLQVKTQPDAIQRIWQNLTGRYPFIKSLQPPQNDHQLMATAAMLSVYRYGNQQALFEFESAVYAQPKLIL